jgi:hypothetical protein
MRLTPPDWRYHRFPIPDDETEEILLVEVSRLGLEMIDLGEKAGDQEFFGRVPHWAHLLKCEQSPSGDWPARVNARTGRPLGDERTRKPAELLARLGAIFKSSEYEGAVSRANAVPGEAETLF